MRARTMLLVYRLDHFQLEFDGVLCMGEPWELRSVSIECLPSSERVGDAARGKYEWLLLKVPLGDVMPGSRGWRNSFQEAANCLARCEERTHEGDMVRGLQDW